MGIIFRDYVGGTFNEKLQKVSIISIANYKYIKYGADRTAMTTGQGKTYVDILNEVGRENVIKIPKTNEGGVYLFEIKIFDQIYQYKFSLPAYDGDPDWMYLFIDVKTPTIKTRTQLTPKNIRGDDYFYFILGDVNYNVSRDIEDLRQYLDGFLLWMMPEQVYSKWGDNNFYFKSLYYTYKGEGAEKLSTKLVLKGRIPIPDNTEQEGGGNGTGEYGNEPIEDENLPDSLIVDSNLLTIYNPAKITVSLISDFLNSGDFLDIWKHKNEAVQSIISFHSIPLKDTDLIAETTTFKLGGVSPSDILGATDISIRKLKKQYYDVDLGEIAIDETVGGFMDYAPYVKMMLFLPFIGVVNVNVNDFMNDVIKLKYSIDVLTGDTLAKVSNSKTLVATFSGNVAIKYPLVATDHSNIYAQALRVGESSLSGYLSGGVGSDVLPNLMSLTMAKPQYKYSGSIGGSLGILGNMTPYVIFHRPVLSYPKDYEKYYGYMSNITAKLSKLKGFTKVKEIHLDDIKCLDSERKEIDELLKSGVIL